MCFVFGSLTAHDDASVINNSSGVNCSIGIEEIGHCDFRSHKGLGDTLDAELEAEDSLLSPEVC